MEGVGDADLEGEGEGGEEGGGGEEGIRGGGGGRRGGGGGTGNTLFSNQCAENISSEEKTCVLE